MACCQILIMIIRNFESELFSNLEESLAVCSQMLRSSSMQKQMGIGCFLLNWALWVFFISTSRGWAGGLWQAAGDDRQVASRPATLKCRLKSGFTCPLSLSNSSVTAIQRQSASSSSIALIASNSLQARLVNRKLNKYR